MAASAAAKTAATRTALLLLSETGKPPIAQGEPALSPRLFWIFGAEAQTLVESPCASMMPKPYESAATQRREYVHARRAMGGLPGGLGVCSSCVIVHRHFQNFPENRHGHQTLKM
jgi:hypothetical protein